MKKSERDAMVSNLVKIQEQLESMANVLNTDVFFKEEKKKPVVNTELGQRNYEVWVLRVELGWTYQRIAEALKISKDQVAESMKVLRDQGCLKSTRKAPTLIEDYRDEVKKLAKKKKNVKQIAEELGISKQTVIRCLERNQAVKPAK